MFRNLSVRWRIYLLVFLMILSLAVVWLSLWQGGASIVTASVKEAQEIMVENQKEKLRLAVHSVAVLLGKLLQIERFEEGRAALMRETISGIHFEDDGSGYYFIYDYDGRSIVQPLHRDFEGTYRLQVRDPSGRLFIKEMRDMAQQGGGFVEYIFDRPGAGPEPKLSYVEPIPGTNYWVGAGIYLKIIDARKAAIEQKIMQMTWQLVSTSIVVLAILLVMVVIPLSHLIGMSIIKPLGRVAEAARAIAEGNLSVFLEFRRKDEMGVLAVAFNDMTARLRDAHQSLKAYQERLEILVKQRTRELWDSLRKLESANERILQSIQYAKTIQQSIMPPDRAVDERLPEHFVIWHPKDVIGGDFYWYGGDETHSLVAVIDCTGHGVPGAIMTMVAVTSLDRVVSEQGFANPARILEELNRLVRQTLSQHIEETAADDGLDIGICSFDPAGEKLVFAGARISLFVSSAAGVLEMKGDRTSLGYKTGAQDAVFANHEIAVEPGMGFYMATDGLIDQVGGEKHLPFGRKRFIKVLEQIAGQSFAAQREKLLQVFNDYKGDQFQRDDVTVFGFRLR